jgi:hypothetical protein
VNDHLVKSQKQKLSTIVQVEAKDMVYLTKEYLAQKKIMNVIVVNTEE